jgi:CRISPR type IV-associated protein Csf2
MQTTETTNPTPARRFEVLRYEVALEAASPIAHHGETIGNAALAMTEKVRQVDGGFARVPIITGDTMRHKLREAASYVFLDAAGLLESRLTEAALRLLFAGGMVTGNGDGSVVKLDHYRRLCELIPSMELLGGCAENRVIPGKMAVERAVLICRESARVVPDRVRAWAETYAGPEDTCRAHIDEVVRVRMDPTLVPEKRELLLPASRAAVEGRLLASETASAEDDAVGKEHSKSSMMPRSFETIATGSLFYWGVEARTHSELERDTFRLMLSAFLAHARVGGKSGTGHGYIKPVQGWSCAIARPSESATAMTFGDVGVGEIFRAHVADRREAIVALLRGVDA